MGVGLMIGAFQQAALGPSHIPIHKLGQQKEYERVKSDDWGCHIFDGIGRILSGQTDGFVDLDQGFQQTVDDLGIICRCLDGLAK
jgi:hypothetical protein